MLGRVTDGGILAEPSTLSILECIGCSKDRKVLVNHERVCFCLYLLESQCDRYGLRSMHPDAEHIPHGPVNRLYDAFMAPLLRRLHLQLHSLALSGDMQRDENHLSLGATSAAAKTPIQWRSADSAR